MPWRPGTGGEGSVRDHHRRSGRAGQGGHRVLLRAGLDRRAPRGARHPGRHRRVPGRGRPGRRGDHQLRASPGSQRHGGPGRGERDHGRLQARLLPCGAGRVAGGEPRTVGPRGLAVDQRPGAAPGRQRPGPRPPRHQLHGRRLRSGLPCERHDRPGRRADRAQRVRDQAAAARAGHPGPARAVVDVSGRKRGDVPVGAAQRGRGPRARRGRRLGRADQDLRVRGQPADRQRRGRAQGPGRHPGPDGRLRRRGPLQRRLGPGPGARPATRERRVHPGRRAAVAVRARGARPRRPGRRGQDRAGRGVRAGRPVPDAPGGRGHPDRGRGRGERRDVDGVPAVRLGAVVGPLGPGRGLAAASPPGAGRGIAVEISLAGKVALVTGVGPNIGSGIALALSRYGAKVACNDVDEPAIKACLDRIERNGGEAMGAPGDVTDEKAVQGYLTAVLERWGHIDILVNNAALLGGRGVLDETAADFEQAVRVSSLGYFLNTKHVGRAMAERGIKGSIVCISSSNAWSGTAGIIAYAFHKGGVNNFVSAAAMALAPYGIRVNSFTPTAPNPDNPELLAERARAGVGPGGVLVHGRAGGLGGPTGDEPWRRPSRWPGERSPMVPMGTTGTPTDIGHAVAWLCSDYARLITGTDLVVDGGARAKNFAYAPAAPEDLAGPLPLIVLDSTQLPEG